MALKAKRAKRAIKVKRVIKAKGEKAVNKDCLEKMVAMA